MLKYLRMQPQLLSQFVAKRAIYNDTRVPSHVLVHKSRPRSSVPNQKYSLISRFHIGQHHIDLYRQMVTNEHFQ